MHLNELQARLKAKRFLVVGSLNIDEIAKVNAIPPDDGCARIERLQTEFGGHAGNCACAIARLGASVSVYGAVGDDPYGRTLLDDLESNGVQTGHVQQIRGVPTGRVIIPCFSDRRFMLMHRGANDALDACAEELREMVRGFDAVVIFDPPETVSAVLLTPAPERFPKLYWSPGGLADRASLHLLCFADAVIMNRVEIGNAFGDDAQRGLEAHLQSAGATHRFIETLGPEGARMYSYHGCTYVPGFRATVADETGAGDAFTAGFAAFESVGFKARESLLFANAMGASAVERIGARAGLPDLRSLVERRDLVQKLAESTEHLPAATRGLSAFGGMS